MNSRTITTHILAEVIIKRHSLTYAFEKHKKVLQQSTEAGLIQELCYGVCRWYPRLQALAQLLLSKPIKSQDQQIYVLILIGLYQLLYLDKPDYAVIDETVKATRALKKPWASKLLNGLLRNFQRKRDDYLQQLDKNSEARYAHPNWLLEAFHQSWPHDWQAILAANNEKAPMILRVNLQKISKKDYIHRLLSNSCHSPAATGESRDNISPNSLIESANDKALPQTALQLTQAIPVTKLPGFSEGLVSVQNLSAQLAASLLDLKAHQRVLDACAAPGGKTTHLLETQADIHLTALDNKKERVQSIKDNLQRLNLNATLQCADATQPNDWWDGKLFDRILIDAPCSGTGVIRRHPDIKLLRQASDIKQYQQQQYKLLQNLWPLLKPGGLLLYATCSILPEENQLLIKQFLSAESTAEEKPIKASWGNLTSHGRQLLPQQMWDGFFYCLLTKKMKSHDD